MRSSRVLLLALAALAASVETAEAGKRFGFSFFGGGGAGTAASKVEAPHSVRGEAKAADETVHGSGQVREEQPVESVDVGGLTDTFKIMSGDEENAEEAAAARKAKDSLAVRMNALPAFNDVPANPARAKLPPVSDLGFFSLAGFIPLIIYFSLLYLVVRLIRRAIERAVWVGGSYVTAFLDGLRNAQPAAPIPSAMAQVETPAGFGLGSLFSRGKDKERAQPKRAAPQPAARVNAQRMTPVMSNRRSTVTRV